MPKVQPKNSFYFFMVDWRKREEALGRRFPGGFQTVANQCGEEWRNLPTEQRLKYEAMAKNSKLQRKMDPKQKYTSYGESFSEIEKKKEEEERRRREKKLKVEQIVQYLNPKSTLRTKSFHLAHVNYFFVHQKTGMHYPAEIGLCEFSLQDGIINSFNAIFRPDEESNPLGYGGAAKMHAEKTHRIPMENTKGSKAYESVYQRVVKFLQGKDGDSKGELPPLYTLGYNEGQNTSDKAVCDCLKLLHNKAHHVQGDEEESWMDQFRVYDLSKLFFELKAKTASFADPYEDEDDDITRRLPHQSMAEDELRKDVFTYAPGIACDFHEQDDNVANCSLSFVRRWVYTICDYCCQDLNIRLQPMSHVPAKADISRPSRVASLASSRATSRAQSRATDSGLVSNFTGEDVARSVTSGRSSQTATDHNTAWRLNMEKPHTSAAAKAGPPQTRLPQTARVGRGTQLLASAWGAPDQKPGRTRTNSEASTQSALSESSSKTLGVEETISSVAQSLSNLGIKPIDPATYGNIQILQGAEEIARFEAEEKARKAAAAPPPKPLFAPDSFPSLGGVGRGRRLVSGRGK